MFEDESDGLAGEAIEGLVLKFDEVVVDHEGDCVVCAVYGRIGEVDKGAEGGVETAQVESVLVVGQFAVHGADEAVREGQIAVLALPHTHTALMVEVDDVLTHLRGVAAMGHHHVGWVQQTLSIYHVPLAFVGDGLVNALLAEVAAQVVLVVLVGRTGEVLGLGADPPLQATVVDILH